eukprot:1160582-Pelagomonas_calceolata.AAC.12
MELWNSGKRAKALIPAKLYGCTTHESTCKGIGGCHPWGRPGVVSGQVLAWVKLSSSSLLMCFVH